MSPYWLSTPMNGKKRHLLTICMLMSFICHQATASSSWESDYALLLTKYATESGVRYAAWSQSPTDLAALKAITRQIAEASSAPSGRNELMAYRINAYNAWILQGVLEKYPVKSVRDIASLFGFFTQGRITVAGEKMSQNRLEKELILKTFKDPRAHFALNCASISCPPLRSEPYTAAKLDSQLTDATTQFLNDLMKAGVISSDGGRTVRVSRIFDWYAADFKASGGPIGFINTYRQSKLSKDIKLEYLEYDWSLNDAR
jgi:hypothetical protein